MSDASTVGAAGAGVFGFLGAAKQYEADGKKADAYAANSRFYKTQAEYAQSASDREQDIFKHNTEILLGRQTSAYGKAGVDLSGSPMMLMGQSKSQADDQLSAIREKGRQVVEIDMLRAKDAQKAADDISDAAFDNFGMNLFGSVLGIGTKSYSGGSSKSTTMDTGSGTYTTTKGSTRTSGNIPYSVPTYSTDWSGE